MAFCNRIGTMLKQSIAHNSSSLSLINSIRCMSSSKLFIGGLSFGTDDHSLKDAFSGFGDVVEAKVITDRDTGRSRGFGFVSFSDTEAASSAMSAMDGKDLNGRSIRVSYANERSSPRYGGGGGGEYSGGYRGGDRGYGNQSSGSGGYGGRSAGGDEF